MQPYPRTRTVDVADEYHGVEIRDPYRWLEDTESPETSAWIDAQNEVAMGHLASIEARDRIRSRLSELWDYTRYGTPTNPVPVLAGGRCFYLRSDGLQNQPSLWMEPEEGGAATNVIDPNDMSPDGTVALTGFDVTRDGSLIAYTLSRGGSDWQEVRVRDVDSGRDLDDLVRWVKFSRPSWTHDGAGFFYSRYPEPGPDRSLLEANRGQRIHYHRLGTGQGSDRLIHERPDEPEWGFQADVTEDGRFVVVHVWHGSATENRLYYIDLVDPLEPALDSPLIPLMDQGDAAYVFVGNMARRFFVLTDRDAPRKRLVSVDVDDPRPESWRTVVAEREEVLESARLLGGRLVLDCLVHARSALEVRSLSGDLVGEIALPSLGSVAGLGGLGTESRMFFSFTSFLHPTRVYRHDLDSGEIRPFGEAPSVDTSAFVTGQEFFTSRDGTRVPMFLAHGRDLVLDEDRPVMIYGYGGFNVSLTPFFSVPNLVWLEMGGVLAVPNLRGGGEYGEEWHRAGTRERKQNVFDDAIAAAQHLISRRYTRPERIAMSGGSNGGLLVGACMTQRPDLFAVALPSVGVMDMLRFHRFTIGWAWVPDYGSADDPEAFPYLLAYSPLHNIEDGACYPATLITTADRDDRVVPGHSFKFAARLQAAQGCGRPTLIRVDRQAGHGLGKPTDKLIEEAVDRLAFAWHHLGQGT